MKKRILIFVIILFFIVSIIYFSTYYYTVNNSNANSNTNSNTQESNTFSNETNESNETSYYLSNADLAYSSNREDYQSDEQFSNFRLVTVGNIKPIIYRGASPVHNSYNRLIITDELLKKNNIKYIINLEDTEESFNNYINKNNLSDSYTNSLYKNNNIYFGNLSIKYETQEYATKMAKSLLQITEKEGPFYIHCNHGRDRTGMACIILEALSDASYTEILNDYMKTFENYNSVNEKTNPEMYQKIFNSRFKNAIYYITRNKNIDDYNSYDYKKAVKKYLQFGGLTESEINKLESCIK